MMLGLKSSKSDIRFDEEQAERLARWDRESDMAVAYHEKILRALKGRGIDPVFTDTLSLDMLIVALLLDVKPDETEDD